MQFGLMVSLRWSSNKMTDKLTSYLIGAILSHFQNMESLIYFLCPFTTFEIDWFYFKPMFEFLSFKIFLE